MGFLLNYCTYHSNVSEEGLEYPGMWLTASKSILPPHTPSKQHGQMKNNISFFQLNPTDQRQMNNKE